MTTSTTFEVALDNPKTKPLDQLCIDTIRTLAMDGVQKANSRSSRRADGPGARRVLAVGEIPASQPGQSALAEPRPVRAVGRARLDVAVQPAASDRVRPADERAGAVPSTGQPHARPSRIRCDARRGSDHRAARSGIFQFGRAWRSPSAGWPSISTATATRSSITEPSPSAATGT
jgi:hypothetical protein